MICGFLRLPPPWIGIQVLDLAGIVDEVEDKLTIRHTLWQADARQPEFRRLLRDVVLTVSEAQEAKP